MVFRGCGPWGYGPGVVLGDDVVLREGVVLRGMVLWSLRGVILRGVVFVGCVEADPQY